MSTTNLGRVTGYSAYEIAVQQGFIGDEDAWLASLQGEDGPAGADGAAAGFGTPTISVSTLSAGSAATASVSATGTDTAKVFHFDFGIPQGEPGSGASLVAGTGIDITGDTISNTMPYDDAATASYIFNNFGMSVSTTTTLESATASIDGGAATVSLFWNRWSKPELSVYVDDTLTDTIEAEDWTHDDQTDYENASLSGGGTISWVQIDQHFLLSGLSGSEVKLEYVGTAIVRTPLDDLYIDNTIARANAIPTLSAGDNITITTSGSVNTISASMPTFTESDPVFSASPAATITASDISNWNSIVGVPTATASDEGKALVVTDSTGSIGWGEVGGGSSYTAGDGIDITNDVISVNDKVYRIINPTGSYEISQIENWNADAKTEVAYCLNHGIPHVLKTGSNSSFTYYYCIYSRRQNSLNQYAYYIERYNYQNRSRMLEVKFNGSTVNAVTASFIPDLPATTSVNNGDILSTDSSGILSWIAPPTPDGTTITASGNVWSAVGGGGSVTSPIEFESAHEEEENYYSALYSDQTVQLAWHEYDSEAEEYTVPTSVIITSNVIGVSTNHGDDESSLLPGSISLTHTETQDVSRYDGGYGATDLLLSHFETENDEEYESANIGFNISDGNDGVVFMKQNGVSADPHSARLYFDGTALKVDIDGTVYTVSLTADNQ